MPDAAACTRYLEQAQVVDNVRLTAGGYKLVLKAPKIAATIRPGQFLNVYLYAHDPAVLLPRQYSVYNMEPTRGTVEIGYEVVGSGTRAISRLRGGQTIQVAGPLGNGFEVDPPYKRMVCVAGGIGVTPFYALLRVYPHQNAVLLFGARNERYLFALKEFESLGVEVRCSTDDGSHGAKGLVTAILEEELKKGTDGVGLAVCGPNPMLRAVARIANRAGVPCQMSMENPMPCGLGVCRGCAWPVRADTPAGYEYRLLCTEGPIMKADRILWPATLLH